MSWASRTISASPGRPSRAGGRTPSHRWWATPISRRRSSRRGWSTSRRPPRPGRRPWSREEGADMTDYTSLDIVRRSASTDQPPTIRNKTEVAKLIDVSKCIGCKACQVACEEWNDLRDNIGTFEVSYNNPHDLSPTTWPLIRFTDLE